jgi:hypothetical protein
MKNSFKMQKYSFSTRNGKMRRRSWKISSIIIRIAPGIPRQFFTLENAFRSSREKRLENRNEQLVEESEVSIIELSFKLYDKGKKSYVKEIEKRLSSPNRVIKYMAAFKLSRARDKKTAKKGLPVLMQILEEEKDDEFKDRAKIAILRVDPHALKDFEEERYEGRAKMLKIRVYEAGKKETKLSLDIPWALADLALAAIPEEEKESMRREGYDLDKIMRELTRVRGNIIEIRSEDSVIKIWID